MKMYTIIKRMYFLFLQFRQDFRNTWIKIGFSVFMLTKIIYMLQEKNVLNKIKIKRSRIKNTGSLKLYTCHYTMHSLLLVVIKFDIIYKLYKPEKRITLNKLYRFA